MKPMLKHNTEPDPAEEFAAFLAIDWADEEHAFHLQVVGQSKIETGTLEQKPHVLIATVAMGLANLFYKVGLQQGALPETMVAAQAWAFCSTATLFGWLRERRFRLTPGAWRYSAFAAVA